jgi:putative NAD(P)-binding protein
MKMIAIFGASGPTGKLFTELALKNDYQVKALVRDASKLDVRHSNLQVVQGDAADVMKVEETIRNTEAVISLLGANLRRGANLQQAVNLRRTTTPILVSAMQQNHVERLVAVASLPVELAAGLLDPHDQPKFMNKWFINRFTRFIFTIFLGKTRFEELIADTRAYFDLIKQSPLRWTIVRAPMLSDQPSHGNYRVGYLDADTGKYVSRSDVAAFLLEVLMNDKYIRQMPIVSS